MLLSLWIVARVCVWVCLLRFSIFPISHRCFIFQYIHFCSTLSCVCFSENVVRSNSGAHKNVRRACVCLSLNVFRSPVFECTTRNECDKRAKISLLLVIKIYFVLDGFLSSLPFIAIISKCITTRAKKKTRQLTCWWKTNHKIGWRRRATEIRIHANPKKNICENGQCLAFPKMNKENFTKKTSLPRRLSASSSSFFIILRSGNYYFSSTNDLASAFKRFFL